MLIFKKKEFWNIIMNDCTIEIILIMIVNYDWDAVKIVKIIKVLNHENFINTHFNDINSLIKKIKAVIFVEQNV